MQDRLVGEAVAEVARARFTAVIWERQHRHPRPAAVDAALPAGRSNEAVALSRQCFNEAGNVAVVAKRRPQPLHGGVETVLEIDEGAVWPQPLDELLACHDLAGALQHHHEDRERLRLQPHALLPAAQLA